MENKYKIDDSNKEVEDIKQYLNNKYGFECDNLYELQNIIWDLQSQETSWGNELENQ